MTAPRYVNTYSFSSALWYLVHSLTTMLLAVKMTLLFLLVVNLDIVGCVLLSVPSNSATSFLNLVLKESILLSLVSLSMVGSKSRFNSSLLQGSIFTTTSIVLVLRSHTLLQGFLKFYLSGPNCKVFGRPKRVLWNNTFESIKSV